MRLTQTAEYALRVMASLASVPMGEARRAKDLAEVTSIPLYYLSKILRRLVVHGLLRSQKGHHGGFVLSRPIAEIRFCDVLVAVDYPMKQDRCAFGLGDCNPINPCPLHPAWSQMVEAFFEWAQTTTLADVNEDAAVNARRWFK